VCPGAAGAAGARPGRGEQVREIERTADACLRTDQRLAGTLARAAAAEAVGREVEALALADRAVALAASQGPAQRAAGHRVRGRVRAMLGEPDAARADLAMAAELSPYPSERARIAVEAAWTRSGDGLLPLVDALEAAFGVAQAEGDAETAAETAVAIAHHLAVVGGDRLRGWITRSEDLLDADDVAGHAWDALTLAYVALADGDHPALLARAEEADRAGTEVDLTQAVIPARILRVAALARLGRLDDAAAAADRLRPEALARPTRRAAGLLGVEEALLAHRRGDRVGALARLQEARVALAPADVDGVAVEEVAALLAVEGGEPQARDRAGAVAARHAQLGQALPGLVAQLLGLRGAVLGR